MIATHSQAERGHQPSVAVHWQIHDGVAFSTGVGPRVIIHGSKGDEVAQLRCRIGGLVEVPLGSVTGHRRPSSLFASHGMTCIGEKGIAIVSCFPLARVRALGPLPVAAPKWGGGRGFARHICSLQQPWPSLSKYSHPGAGQRRSKRVQCVKLSESACRSRPVSFTANNKLTVLQDRYCEWGSGRHSADVAPPEAALCLVSFHFPTLVSAS